MKIKDRVINESKPPFVIAEISANHNNSLKRALRLIDEAKEAGADAVKLQTYKPSTIAVNSDKKEFVIKDRKSLWYGKSLYELYKIGSMPWEWHKELFKRAKKNNIICFSSPFDESAVDFLKKLKSPAYKVASFENNHVPLMKKIIAVKKPTIVSLGITKLNNIKNIVNLFKKSNHKNFALLKCTSSYPAPVEESNLKTIKDLKKRFKVQIGISDHTQGIGVAIASISYGASIIEKHFTLNKKSGGLDDSFSIDPKELKDLVVESKRAWSSQGKVYYDLSKSEKKSNFFKRSIFIISKMKKGERFTDKNLKILRPNLGLDPKYYYKVLGKKCLLNLSKNTPLKSTYVSKK